MPSNMVKRIGREWIRPSKSPPQAAGSGPKSMYVRIAVTSRSESVLPRLTSTHINVSGKRPTRHHPSLSWLLLFGPNPSLKSPEHFSPTPHSPASSILRYSPKGPPLGCPAALFDGMTEFVISRVPHYVINLSEFNCLASVNRI